LDNHDGTRVSVFRRQFGPLLPDSRAGARRMTHRFALLAISGTFSRPRPIRRRHALARFFFCIREFTR